MMCDGLRALFGHESTAEVVGETNVGPQAHERVRELKPDLVLTDIASWAGGVETIRSISQELTETKIIVISAFCSRAFITQTLSSGAQGYVVKKNGFSELLQAVKTVCSGAAYLCSRSREVVLSDYATGANSGRAPHESLLTDRECTVLRLLAEGRTSKEIGLILDVSSKTVDACRRRLMKKIDVESLADLVKSAIVMGLTTVTPQSSSAGLPCHETCDSQTMLSPGLA